MPRDVVLVPGLWMPVAGFWPLVRHLRRAGYIPHCFDYRGRDSFAASVKQLERYARALGRPAHFVGHSLGGVLVLETLVAHPDLPIGCAVLLGAPVDGCETGRRLGRTRIGRWMMGRSFERWQARTAEWPRPEPLGVVAGTLPLGLGRILGALPERNDGVVCVSETEVRGMADRALVAVGHSGLIFSRRVNALLDRFLAVGRFG